MRKFGRRADLALEASERDRVRVVPRANPLQRAGPLQERVFGQVDLAHAAAADQFLEAVLPKSACPCGFLSQPVHEVHPADDRAATDD